MEIIDTDGMRYGPVGPKFNILNLFRPADIPRCGACHRPVGPENEPCEMVGSVVIACDTCYGPSPLRGEVGCNCWVRDRPVEERIEIRYGAHDVRCPAWAPSLDPVDAANDAELRLRLDR